MAARPRQQTAAPRVQGWSDAAFARVADAVYLVAGLVFPPNRQPSAEAGMRRAMTALRIADPAALARAVESPGEPRDTVLAELTVGETYFFRDAGQLDVLRTEILPSHLARRGPAAPLRVWSAGCASGEEPYTVAIMLRELAWPQQPIILGTDVARPRLEAGRRGRYTKWSLRGVSEARVDRWFTRRGAQFQLNASIREAVRLAPLNLIADEYPATESGTMDQDVVLCRNVLIYFDMKSVAEIATRLLASLAPDGWLILGASDPPLSGLVPCEVVMTAGGLAYRRADRDPARVVRTAALDASAAEQARRAARWYSAPDAARWIEPDLAAAPMIGASALPVAPPAWANAPEPAADVASRRAADVSIVNEAAAAYAAADYPRAELLARAALAADAESLDAWVLLVRALANQGRITAALEQCALALSPHRMSPELHYLHAMLLGAESEHGEAAKAARRAIYLDAGFVVAHLQLGDALARTGDVQRSALAFEHAARALSTIADDRPVPGADGVSASRLRQIAESRLRALHAAGAT